MATSIPAQTVLPDASLGSRGRRRVRRAILGFFRHCPDRPRVSLVQRGDGETRLVDRAWRRRASHAIKVGTLPLLRGHRARILVLCVRLANFRMLLVLPNRLHVDYAALVRFHRQVPFYVRHVAADSTNRVLEEPIAYLATLARTKWPRDH